jgi:hypothetical protein
MTSSPVGSAGTHGRITPFTSSVVWPSDTPPSSGSSGGGPSIDTVNSSSGGSSNVSSDFMIDNAPGVADHSLASSSVYSPAGVRYFDGQINVSSTDLSTDGFGSLRNQTRSWSNGTPPSSDNGSGIIDWDRPYLLEPNGNNSEIVVVSKATDAASLAWSVARMCRSSISKTS